VEYALNTLVAVPALIFMFLAAASDLRARRISNKLNLCAALLGAWLHFVTGGVEGLGMSLGGMTAGLALLFVPFAAGMVGGGDVKFAAAAGSFLGAGLLCIGLGAGVLLAGVVGVGSILCSGKAKAVMLGLWADLNMIASGQRPGTLKAGEGTRTMPYGLMLAVGMAGTLVHATWRIETWLGPLSW